MSSDELLYTVDLDRLAQLVGCTEPQLRKQLVTSGAVPSAFAEVSSPSGSSAPDVQVKLTPLHTRTALVVTSQYGYDAEADSVARNILPNELLLFEGKPLISYCLEQCIDAGLEKIVLVVHEGENGKEIVRLARAAVGSRLDLQVRPSR
jgi:hypothetical protein